MPQQQEARIKALKKRSAFKMLESDILSGEVFPALRESVIDFYHMGARLCSFKGGNMIWHKNKPDPLSENDYGEIKKECVCWSYRKNGTINERASLSALCRDKTFSPYMSSQASIILLDIEVGFPCLTSNGQVIQNVQVDLLFVDPNTGILYFIEAKEANDSRIKTIPRENESEEALFDRLEVTDQIRKYDANLSSEERTQEILKAYTNYLNIMEKIFGCQIQTKPLSLYPHPKLFVFGESTANGKECLKALRFKLGDDLIVKQEAWHLTKGDIVK